MSAEVEELRQLIEELEFDNATLRMYQDEAERRMMNVAYVLNIFADMKHSLDLDVPVTVVAIRERFHRWVLHIGTELKANGKPLFSRAQFNAILTAEAALDDVIGGRWK